MNSPDSAVDVVDQALAAATRRLERIEAQQAALHERVARRRIPHDPCYTGEIGRESAKEARRRPEAPSGSAAEMPPGSRRVTDLCLLGATNAEVAQVFSGYKRDVLIESLATGWSPFAQWCRVSGEWQQAEPRSSECWTTILSASYRKVLQTGPFLEEGGFFEMLKKRTFANRSCTRNA